MDLLWLLVVGVVLAVLVLWRRRAGWRAAWLRWERMPKELQTAHRVASEEVLRCERPIALSGAPDPVYPRADGALVLVETKRRQRAQVYDADLAQLSTYRLLLAGQKRFREQPVADYGYVRLATPDGIIYRRVSWWEEARVVELHRRYWALRVV